MTLRIGESAIRQFALDITPETDGDVNLTDVTAAVIRMRRADGTEADLSVTMSSQTTSTLRLTHDVEETDFTVAGVYAFYAVLTFADGELWTSPVREIVKGPFD